MDIRYGYIQGKNYECNKINSRIFLDCVRIRANHESQGNGQSFYRLLYSSFFYLTKPKSS